MTLNSNNFTEKALEALYVFSGYRCSHPQCTKKLVQFQNDDLPDMEVGQIYEISHSNGSNLVTESNNHNSNQTSFDNQILFCPEHYNLIANQSSTYPPERLRKWKTELLSTVENQLNFQDIDTALFTVLPTKMVDKKIKNEIERAQKLIWLADTNQVESFKSLGDSICDGGELSSGSGKERSNALAICSQNLSKSKYDDLANKYLQNALILDKNIQTSIAKAFIESNKVDVKEIVKELILLKSPEVYTATLKLMILNNNKNKAEILDWYKNNISDASKLTSEGKSGYLLLLHELELWDDALKALDKITEEDFNTSPILHFLVAISYLTSVVPLHLKREVSLSLPYVKNALNSLKTDNSSMKIRELAKNHFVMAKQFFQEFHKVSEAELAGNYALWFELENSLTRKNGIKELKKLLVESDSIVHLVPLLKGYDVEFDIERVERELKNLPNTNSYQKMIKSTAYFTLTITQESPKDCVSFFERHLTDIMNISSYEHAKKLYIEILAKSGKREEARNQLKDLKEKGLPNSEVIELEKFIRLWTDEISTDELIANYQKQNDVSLLYMIVNKLLNSKRWEDLVTFSKELFDMYNNVSNAEYYTTALFELQKYTEVVNFLTPLEVYRKSSNNLQMYYCWSLFLIGDLLKSKEELVKIKDGIKYENYRNLFLNILSSLGDWNESTEFFESLDNITEDQVANKFFESLENIAEDLGADELLRIANHIKLTNKEYAKKFINLAVKKDDTNPNVLANAYFQYTSMGLENEREAVEWFEKAARLSDEDGPLKKYTVDELYEELPKLRDVDHNLVDLLVECKIPMATFAGAKRMPLSNIMMQNAQMNLEEHDPRLRTSIPAFSGNTNFNYKLNDQSIICIDISAIYTLSNLNLLEKTIDAFSKIYIPHGTENWITDEISNTPFHQPTRIIHAQKLCNLIDSDNLHIHSSKHPTNLKLATNVGNELAENISEAVAVDNKNSAQRIVVCPNPVYRFDSRMKEIVDLNEYKHIMCSCLSIIQALKNQNKISDSEFKQARKYFEQQEEPWPNQIQIEDNAVLYLNGLAIEYFLILDLLEKITESDYKVSISNESMSLNEAKSLIKYENYANKICKKLESIKSIINESIKSQKISHGSASSLTSKLHSEYGIEIPTFNIFALAEICDVAVIDDQFFNRHNKLNANNDVKCDIVTSYCILKFLWSSNKIDTDKFFNLKTQLRQMGYFYLPLEEGELEHYMLNSTTESHEFYESLDLKAIRENLLKIQMSNWIQQSIEQDWLKNLLKLFLFSLISIWGSNKSESFKIECSNWIISQCDLVKWAHVFKNDTMEEISYMECGLYLRLIVCTHNELNGSLRDSYWNWLSEKVLIPMQDNHPNMYEWLLNSAEDFIAINVSKNLDFVQNSENRLE